MLSAILTSVGGAFISKFFDAAKDIFHDYQQGKITAEECKTRLLTSLLETAKAVEVSHSETLAKTYDSFTKAMVQSKLMQCVWASVCWSQLLVLVWYQAGVPLLCYAVGNKTCFPSAGSTIEWAYLLLAACLGMGPVILRNGPGKLDINEFKRLIGR